MKNLDFMDWMLLGMMVISYLFIAVKSGEWLVGAVLKKCHRIKHRKNKRLLAVEDLLEAYPISSKNGSRTITMRDGWKIKIWHESQDDKHGESL